MSTVIKQLTAQLKGLKDEMAEMKTEMTELKQLVKDLNDNVNALVEEVDLEAELNAVEEEEKLKRGHPDDLLTDEQRKKLGKPPIAPKLQRETVTEAGKASLAYLKKHSKQKQPPE